MHIAKGNNPKEKLYILSDSNYTALWKRQNYRGNKKKKSVVARCLGPGEEMMNRWHTGFFRQGNYSV